MKKPLIILSNDDGIGSDGLKKMYEAVEGLGDIVIAAPDRQRSGASHALSVIDRIKVKKVRFEGAAAYSVSGTPVDCAKLALLNLAGRKPALLLSGINHGPNIAQFILYSGTIGAAAEAAILGIPAVAFSIDSYEPFEWDYAVGYIRGMVKKVLSGSITMRKHTLLNVNFPHVPANRVKGVKVLPRGGNEFKERYIAVRKTAGSVIYRHVISARKKGKKISSDAGGVETGYVTVTALDFRLNDPAAMKALKKKIFK
jgi:5'-nucleotidase